MTDEKSIEDYRVYVDPDRKRVVLVFRAGDVQMSVNANAADTERLIDALTRAVAKLHTPAVGATPRRHRYS